MLCRSQNSARRRNHKTKQPRNRNVSRRRNHNARLLRSRSNTMQLHNSKTTRHRRSVRQLHNSKTTNRIRQTKTTIRSSSISHASAVDRADDTLVDAVAVKPAKNRGRSVELAARH